jgi:8-oxo-dGTP diphosphatase
MPVCRETETLRSFLEAHRPGTNSIYYSVLGKVGAEPRWVRVDDLGRPRAVICRTDRFMLYGTDSRAVSKVVEELPRNMRMRFGATQEKYYRLIRRRWRGPDTGKRTWVNSCYLYALTPGRLVVCRSRRVSPLGPDDAGIIVRYWPYGRSLRYVVSRIRALPGCAIRHKGRLVAWTLTHDDGSMGFLHVIEEYRGQDMARTLTTALAELLLKVGIQPFMYIVRNNRASIALTGSMGFTRRGEYSWFGTV